LRGGVGVGPNRSLGQRLPFPLTSQT
jgi:hypothetical protein